MIGVCKCLAQCLHTRISINTTPRLPALCFFISIPPLLVPLPPLLYHLHSIQSEEHLWTRVRVFNDWIRDWPIGLPSSEWGWVPLLRLPPLPPLWHSLLVPVHPSRHLVGLHHHPALWGLGPLPPLGTKVFHPAEKEIYIVCLDWEGTVTLNLKGQA